MTKHAAGTGRTTKIFAAAGALAFGLSGFGIFSGVSTAVADGTLPDSGSYDELLNIPDDNATHEAPDTGSYPAQSSWPGG